MNYDDDEQIGGGEGTGRPTSPVDVEKIKPKVAESSGEIRWEGLYACLTASFL